MLRIKVSIWRARYAYVHGFWKNAMKNITRASRVKIRGHHDDAVPFSFFYNSHKCLSLFQGTVPIVRKPNNLISRHSSLDQIVFHQLRDSRIRTHASSASDNNRGLPFPEQLCSLRVPISSTTDG